MCLFLRTRDGSDPEIRDLGIVGLEVSASRTAAMRTSRMMILYVGVTCLRMNVAALMLDRSANNDKSLQYPTLPLLYSHADVSTDVSCVTFKIG